MEKAISDSTTEPFSILKSSYENALLFILCVLTPGGSLNQMTCALPFLDQMLLMPPQSSFLRGVGRNIHFSGDVTVKNRDEKD